MILSTIYNHIMNITVKVKPKAREEKVEKLDNTRYVVYTKELPEKGKANKGIVRLLSKYFLISQSKIMIVSGQKSRTKIVNIKL